MIEAWFPTPIYISQLEGDTLSSVQDELLPAYRKIKDKMVKNPRWERDNHSISDVSFDSNFLLDNSCQQSLDIFGQHIVTFLRELGLDEKLAPQIFIKSSWATQTKRHEYARLHDHGASDMSGVYYLQTNSEDGNFYFKSPNTILTQTYIAQKVTDERDIVPEVGKIILWPGYLQHGTRVNNTEHERVSISFNVTIQRG